MKAHINGITLEGTPEEVWAIIQRNNAVGTQLKPYHEMPDWNGPWWGIFPPHQHGTGTADVPYWLKYPAIITCNIVEE